MFECLCNDKFMGKLWDNARKDAREFLEQFPDKIRLSSAEEY